MKDKILPMMWKKPFISWRTQLCQRQNIGINSAEHCVKYDNCEDCMAEKMIEIVESGGTAVGQKGERE